MAVKRLRTLDIDSHGDDRQPAGQRCPEEATRSQAAFKQFFEREIAILASIRHPNVVNFIGACHRPPNRCLVTEYCARGSLDQLLHKSGERTEDRAAALRLGIGPAALPHVHSAAIPAAPLLHACGNVHEAHQAACC